MPEETILFRPIDRATLDLMLHAYEEVGEDPIKSFSLLFSAAIMASATMGMTKQQWADLVGECLPNAVRAFNERPDIFGHIERPQ